MFPGHTGLGSAPLWASIFHHNSQEAVVWRPEASSTRSWREATIFLGSVPSTFRIRLHSQRSEGLKGDVAIDQLEFLDCALPCETLVSSLHNRPLTETLKRCLSLFCWVSCSVQCPSLGATVQQGWRSVATAAAWSSVSSVTAVMTVAIGATRRAVVRPETLPGPSGHSLNIH